MGVLLAMFVYLCLLLVVVEDLVPGKLLSIPGTRPHTISMGSSFSLLNNRDGGRLLRLWLLTLAIRVLVLKASNQV